MAQDRFINITLDPNVAARVDRSGDQHNANLGATHGAEVTVSFDTSKITTLSVLRSAVASAMQQAANTLKP